MNFMTTYEEFTQLLNGVTNCSDEEKAKNGLQELLHVFEMETMTERVGLLVDNKQIECWSSGGTEDLCDGGILTACMTKLIKRFSTNDEILTSASEIISMSCGETALKKRSVRLTLDADNELLLDFALPCFAAGDVGFRIWASSKAICSWMIQNAQAFREFSNPVNCIELGCGSFPLVGLVCSDVLKAKSLVITDYNEECLLLAKQNTDDCKKKNPQRFDINVLSQVLDWSAISNCPKADFIIGSACVYEEAHARILPGAMRRCAADTGAKALIAIHDGHSGFDSFLDECQQQDFIMVKHIGPIEVIENSRSSNVHFFFYQINAAVVQL